jgi:hypothetical protein
VAGRIPTLKRKMEGVIRVGLGDWLGIVVIFWIYKSNNVSNATNHKITKQHKNKSEQ